MSCPSCLDAVVPSEKAIQRAIDLHGLDPALIWLIPVNDKEVKIESCHPSCRGGHTGKRGCKGRMVGFGESR